MAEKQKRRRYARREGLYSISEAARRIGVLYQTLYKHVSLGYLFAPTHGGGKRKYYDDADLIKIKEYWSR